MPGCEIIWSTRNLAVTSSSIDSPRTGRTILVTGAGGSIGSALCGVLARCDPEFLILLDHSEHALHEIDRRLIAGQGRKAVSILGDVLDDRLLQEIFARYRPEIIFHAAAFKHVPLMERNPLAVIRNNAIATWELAKAACRHSVSLLLMISSDKAVNPGSIMGASKRVAELALLALATPNTRMSAVRLSNVLGSQGSVAPIFEQQIRDGGPVTVTDTEARRYFVSMEEAVELIVAAAELALGEKTPAAARPGGHASIFIPKIGEPIKIIDLARRMIRQASDKSNKIETAISGMRPGEKLSEAFVFAGETLWPTANEKLLRVEGNSTLPTEEFMRALTLNVQRRDIGAALDAILKLVPEYSPSETLLANREFRGGVKTA